MKIKRVTHRSARIEMLPLIDIVFLLLVFFIYAMMSMAVHNGLQLNLPASSQAVRSPESPVSLFIRGADGSIELFLGEVRVAPDGLGRLVRQQLEAAGDRRKPVLLFAEKDVSYQSVYSVLDKLAAAGVHDISLQATLDDGGPYHREHE